MVQAALVLVAHRYVPKGDIQNPGKARQLVHVFWRKKHGF
jgi:hypothetical protein